MSDNYLSRKSQLFLLFLLTGIFYLNILSRLIMAPLLPVLEKELGISHSVSGSFFMFIALGYSGGLFGSGFVSGWLSNRRTIVLSAVSLALAFYLVALSDTVWAIRLGLLFMGVATGLYIPAGMTALTLAIRPENWGKAIAVHEYAPTLAYMSAPLLAEVLIGIGGWQGIVLLIGTGSLMMGFFFRRFAPGSDFKGDRPCLADIRHLVRGAPFWIMTAFFTLAIGATVGLYSMMPLYLIEERGIDRTLANSLIGLSRLPLLAIVLAAGWLSDRFGPKPVITVVMLFNALTTILLAVVPGQWVFVVLFLHPMLTVCFFPAGFTILSRISPAPSRSLLLSLTMLSANLIGGGIFPLVLGFFGDAQAFGTGFVLFGVIMFLSILLIPFLKLPE